jgi:hypothetical protein
MSAYWVEPTRNWRVDLVELAAERVEESGIVSDRLWLRPFGVGPSHVQPVLLGEVFDPDPDRHSERWADEMIEACLARHPW